MSENKYIKDETLDENYRDQGILNYNSLLIGVATITAGTIAYKKGALRGTIKNTLENLSKIKPLPTIAVNDVRKWINTDYNAPMHSVFRTGVFGTIKDGIGFNPKGIYESIKNKNSIDDIVKNFYKKDALKYIYEDTKHDIKDYKNRLSFSIKNLTENSKSLNKTIYNNAHNTDLLREIKDINDAKSIYSKQYNSSKKTLESFMYDDLFKTNIQKQDTINKQLKRTGYRKVQLEDLFDITIVDNNVSLTPKKTLGVDYSFSKHGEKDAILELEKILNSNVLGESGRGIYTKNKKLLKMHEKHKDFGKLAFDKNILINEGKNIIDLRDQKRNAYEFIGNLATDWAIPIININPLQLVGLDRLTKRNIKYGSIHENMVAPFLTGHRGNEVEHTIKNLKDKVDILKGVKEGVTIINGDVYKIAEDNIGIKKMEYKSKKKLIEITKSMDAGFYNLTPTENSLRKIGGIGSRKFEDYKIEDGKYKYYKQKVAKFFDVGYQERTLNNKRHDSIFEKTNPDNFIGNILEKISPKPYKESETIKNLSGTLRPHSRYSKSRDSLFVINDTTKLKDVFELDKEALKDTFADIKNTFKNKKNYNVKKNIDRDYVKIKEDKLNNFINQYISTFSKDTYENVNKRTGIGYFILERLNQTISNVGFGLSLESTKDTISTAKNLLLKRFAPIYLGYKAVDLINIFGEDNDKEASTVHQKLIKKYSEIDIGAHKISESLGISNLFKNISQITPGSDMLSEIPGINLLNLSDTEEDRREYWKNGYDPVRKGRYWSLNTTPFVGGRVQYHKANPLNRALADAKYSDSLYGSRKERLLNLLDKDHYDKRNYEERPYLLTSSAFENVPLIGPLLSSTIGRVIAPPKRMHTEYWKNKREVLSPKEAREVERSGKYEVLPLYLDTYKDITSKSKNKYYEMYLKLETAMNNIFGFADLKKEKNYRFDTEKLLGVVSPYNNYSLYRTNSGSMKVINTGMRGYDESNTVINRIGKDGFNTGQAINLIDRVNFDDENILSKQLVEDSLLSNAKNPYSIGSSLKDQYVDFSNVAGIYGFGVSGFLTGNIGHSETKIETSGYSRSFNKEFFDSEIGGFGGDLSEIFRRFVQNRRKDQKYYNPIKNRMPEWLPGEGEFIDFKHGDPFSKIPLGEERLPGEGYERLHNINMDLKLQMKAGSSIIGKTKDDIITHILGADTITDKRLQNIVDTGTKYHEKIEDDMLKSGIAIDVEREVFDKENNIVGTYDVRLNDASSKTGEAIMDIKTIGDSGFKEILKSRQVKDEHRRQVNFYLHNTNKNSKGYVHYVNRDNPRQSMTLGFNYSSLLYDSSINTLNQAREDIKDMMKKGILSKADLYSQVDKYRILADVAPYSKEFTEMNKVMSNAKLSDKDKEEVKKIRDRHSIQTTSLRLYDYRFKYNDTEKMKIKIGNQIDSEKYRIDNTDNVIKLAGVNIKKDNPNYDKAMEFLNKHLVGENVDAYVAKDELKRNNNDSLKTIKATIYNNGMNLNKELIKRGYADEDEKDFSASGVKARFNAVERTFGSVFENIAHFDSFANTKLLQVRSAYEDYSRKQVYNKEFKEWQEPIKDFILPSIWSNMNRTGGVLFGAGVGYLLGKSKFGKLAGSTIGATFMLGAKGYKKGYEKVKDEKWIPKQRREERELEEYIDKLKFVKNRRLYEIYADKSFLEDKFDVREFIKNEDENAKFRKTKINSLKKVKRKDKLNDTFSIKEYEKLGVKFETSDKLPPLLRELFITSKEKVSTFMSKLPFPFNSLENREGEYENLLDVSKPFNEETRDKISSGVTKEKELKELKNSVKNMFESYDSFKKPFSKLSKMNDNREYNLKKTVNKEIEDTQSKKAFKLNDNAMKAIHYYNESEKTMYGYDEGEPLNNFALALPKKDRMYFRKFLDAPKEEREKIIDIAPRYMKRALQSAYKMKVDKKESLEEYFKSHALPNVSWDGYRENYDLDSMKVKMIQTQNLELGDFNAWENDKKKADMYGKSRIPNINYKSNLSKSTNALRNLLGESGIENINISYSFSKGTSGINLNISEDLENKYNSKLKERLKEYE